MASNISQTFSQDSSGDINVGNIVGTVSLPTGAATAANQATEITELTSIATTSNSTAVNTNTIAANQTNGNQRTLVSDLVGNLQPAGDAPVRAISIKVTDGTNTAGVAPASTAATATQPALVTAFSPNSPLPAGSNLIGLANVGGLGADGSAVVGNPVRIAGKDAAGNTQDVITDTVGNQTSTPVDGYKATYSASIVGLITATTPTDVFTLTGSASKTIRVIRISVGAVQNTSATRDILLIKRSAANIGGTSTSPTVVPHDSSNAAGTGTVLAYTANPTSLGTAVGTLKVAKIQQLATNVTTALDHVLWDFGNRPSQAVVLRGTSQVLAINLNSVTSSNNSFSIDIEWTEE